MSLRGIQGNGVSGGSSQSVAPNDFECVAWASAKPSSNRATPDVSASGEPTANQRPTRAGNTSQPFKAVAHKKAPPYYALQDFSSGRGSPQFKPAPSVGGNAATGVLRSKQTALADAGAKHGNTRTVNRMLAPTASELAKERAAMLSTVDTLVESALGKGRHSKPADHRGYTALVGKALRSMKSSSDRAAFKSAIEAAGRPFGLNFGLSNKVNGKRVALNQGAAAMLDANHRAAYSKFAQEYSAPQPKATVKPVRQHEESMQAMVAAKRDFSHLIA
jgi:hypothetical protein